MKNLLADEKNRIKLTDFIRKEALSYQKRVSTIEFPKTGSPVITNETIRNRIEQYEVAVTPLLQVGFTLGYYGGRDELKHLKLLFKHFTELRPERNAVWGAIDSYPLLLLFYSVGIGAILGENYRVFRSLFNLSLDLYFIEYRNSSWLDQMGGVRIQFIRDKGIFNRLYDGHKYAPQCERMLEFFKSFVSDLFETEESVEEEFDRFELLFAFGSAFEKRNEGNDLNWWPIGRFWWKYHASWKMDGHPLATFVEEGRRSGKDWQVFDSGIFGESGEFFANYVERFETQLAQNYTLR